MWLTRVSVHHPVFATMMMMAFVVLGIFSYQRLRVDQFPDINFPVVVVTTEYPGASPESVESEVTRKIEEQVNTVSGIKALYSRSYEGTSVVIIEFELTIDPAQAAQDIREKIALVRPIFRKEIKESRVTRFDPADQPIITLSLRLDSSQNNAPIAQVTLRNLTTLADQLIKKRLENVRGVGQVSIVGGIRRQINIAIDPAAMESLGLGVEDVLEAVRRENLEFPAGAIKTTQSEHLVQIDGRIKEPKDFGRIIVTTREGKPLYLEQIAQIIDGQQEQESLALINGKRTLALNILKAQGQNTIEVADGIKRAIEQLKPELPPGVVVDVIKDTSTAIRTGVANVQRTLLEGALLTILIVFLFLASWRSTVITGLTLPISLIGTFLVMYVFGFTLNMLTLMALSLCVGLLIDDAIVVRENIVRHARMGKDHRQAALEGTTEIGLAVLATTLSIVAVFLPVGFMGGIIGRFFHQFGITVAAAVLISMFVSFTLDPMLSAVWPDPPIKTKDQKNFLTKILDLFEGFTEKLSALYQVILRWSLAHRVITLLIAAATFLGSFLLVPLLGSEFVPQADFGETMVRFNTPVGSSLEYTEEKARQVEQALHSFPEVLSTNTTINTGALQGKDSAEIYIKLKARKERKVSQFELIGPIRARLAEIAGIRVTHVGPLSGVGGTKILLVSLQGSDLQELARYNQLALDKLAKVPGIVDLDSSLKAAKPTVAVTVKREIAADLGLDVSQIANTLRPLIAGEIAGTWRGPDDENYDINVQLQPQSRNHISDLEKLSLRSSQLDSNGQPKLVPLREVATLTPTLGASQINRRDLTREVQIDANVYGRSAGEVGQAMVSALEQIEWKPGYRFKIGGSTKDMQESLGYALSALLLAIVFIYMILASQFGSFLQPLAIMSSLPLTLIGVFLSLLFFHSTLNLFSIIGFIMLMGLVTKNAILLIDFVNQARRGEHGHALLNRNDALLEAARVRLRPILMTTLAMVFGMLPLALGLSEGSEQRAPMGQAVIGGIMTSSLLTLVVVPVIYTYLDDLAQRFFPQKSLDNAA